MPWRSLWHSQIRNNSQPITATDNLQPATRTSLLAGVVGGGVGVGGEPLVEGDGEGEEFLLAVEGVDHLDVELGVLEGGVVEVLDVVEEVAGERGVGADGVPGKPKSLSSSEIFLSTGVRWMGNGVERDVDGLGAVHGEDAAVDVVFGGGGDLVVVGGDELHAGVFEREGAVGVVGDDDADGQQAVLDVRQAEEAALLGVVAGIGGDGDVLVGVGVVGGVLGGGLGGWRGFVSAAWAAGGRRQSRSRGRRGCDGRDSGGARAICAGGADCECGFMQARLSSSLVPW